MHFSGYDFLHSLKDFSLSSFTDTFNTTFCLKKGIKEIYSYDEDFDKIEGIKRITP